MTQFFTITIISENGISKNTIEDILSFNNQTVEVTELFEKEEKK